MDISIIIVSWNVRELLKKCLDSVIASVAKQSYNRTEQDTGDNQIHRNDKIASVATRSQGKGWLPRNDIDFEIIVVDNSSSDSTADILRQYFSVIPAKAGIQSSASGLDSPRPSRRAGGMTIKLIQNIDNKGFSAANNQGIRQAKGRYILLLNPDTEFMEDTLAKVVAKMESDPSIGVLGCQLLNRDGSIQPSVRRFPTIWSQLVILTKLHHIWPTLLGNYLARDFDYTPPLPLLGEEGIDVVEVDQVMGAFFCVRREVFDKIGLLDEGYFIWFEEVDFCRRAKAAGYKVVYWPGTQIVHHGNQSFKQQMTLKKQWWFFKSALRYFLLSSRTK